MFYRVVIRSSDVAVLCGMSERNARRLLEKIKKKYKKKRREFVSIDEFCEYTGLTKELVYNYFDQINEPRCPMRNADNEGPVAADGET